MSKTILVTGGTGTFGHEFVNYILNKTTDSVIVFSRDELKQANMAKEFGDNPRLKFRIGDVRDESAVRGLFLSYNITDIAHAAAMKRIEQCEMYPQEAFKTNVLGSANIANCAKEFGVKNLIAVSTDKAVKPTNAYGASKKLMEHIILNAGYSVIRYGNVIGSRGSVIPIWIKQFDNGEDLTVTDLEATRFFLRISEAVKLTYANMSIPGLHIPKMKSTELSLLVTAIGGLRHPKVKVTGLGKFEKKHEDISDDLDSSKAERFSFKEIDLIVQEVREQLNPKEPTKKDNITNTLNPNPACGAV